MYDEAIKMRTLPWYIDHDRADAQWHMLVRNYPLILTAVALHLTLSRAGYMLGIWKETNALVGCAFVVLLHGGGAVPLFATALLVYLCKNWRAVTLAWFLGVGTLAYCDRNDCSITFAPFVSQWYVHYNFVWLRLISYAADSKGKEKFADFAAYLFYPPLYLAGPIAHFEDFRCTKLQLGLSKRLFRWLLTLALAVSTINLLRPWSVVRAGGSNAGPLLDAFWVLMSIYLKFLVIWRGFALWAAFDGVAVPENMKSCICVPCGISTFWKTWHSSFRRWIVKYVYVPLGGDRKGKWRAVINKMLVFAFVAAWHDRNAKMLHWGTFLAVFVIIEQLYPATTPNMRANYCFLLVIANAVGFGHLNSRTVEVRDLFSIALWWPSLLFLATQFSEYKGK